MLSVGPIDAGKLFRGSGELARARSDPAMRARIDELKRRDVEAIRRWLAKLENYYWLLHEADPVTPDRLSRLKGSEWDSAAGRDLILKLIRLAQAQIEGGQSLTCWTKEIRDLDRMHSRVSIALGFATRDGLRARERETSMRQKAQVIREAERQRKEENIRSLFARISASNPRWSFTRCCKEVGRRSLFGMSGRNVRRYIDNPTPRKKK